MVILPRAFHALKSYLKPALLRDRLILPNLLVWLMSGKTAKNTSFKLPQKPDMLRKSNLRVEQSLLNPVAISRLATFWLPAKVKLNRLQLLLTV